MQLTPQAWEAVAPHVAADNRYPPRAVHLAVLALVDPLTIKASRTTFDYSSPSRWTVTLLTGTSVAHVEMLFDEEVFDQQAEQDRDSGQPAVQATIVHAWVKPLTTINRFAIKDVGRLKGETLDWFAVGDLVLGFADGTDELTLPGQSGIYLQDRLGRQRSDDFLAALRSAIPF